MYSIVMLAALGSAPAAPDALLVRRAGAGCAGNAAVARASAGCNGGNAVALVPVQAYAAVAVNQDCNGATAAAAATGCSGGNAGLLGHQRRVARREARRSGAQVNNSLPVAVQLPAAPPVAAQLPAQPAVAVPAPKATTVHPQAFLVPAPSSTAVVAAPVKVKTRTVYRAAPARFSNCPNGNCPR